MLPFLWWFFKGVCDSEVHVLKSLLTFHLGKPPTGYKNGDFGIQCRKRREQISLQNSDLQNVFHESTGIKQHEWENAKQKVIPAGWTLASRSEQLLQGCACVCRPCCEQTQKWENELSVLGRQILSRKPVWVLQIISETERCYSVCCLVEVRDILLRSSKHMLENHCEL